MESTKKRPHQALSLEKKLQILQDLDCSGLSKTEAAKKFNIPKSTLSRNLKNKEAIEDPEVAAHPSQFHTPVTSEWCDKSQWVEYPTNPSGSVGKGYMLL
ncbi:hypothetical protein HPB50_014614 [Hyalomma asiaticum]|uniref:Uncharacterized protein n=1 Tax=Hyalomma asiaticum TaxID=266040 RepID=A0ACB7TI23_HYAAI|nr:hypothetical protein HPB50_014614 [Hyalomma asiaticum]